MKATSAIVTPVGSGTSSFDGEKYKKALENGACTIESLLQEFKLPATTGGRGKIRKFNEKWNEEHPENKIIPVNITSDGKTKRGFAFSGSLKK